MPTPSIIEKPLALSWAVMQRLVIPCQQLELLLSGIDGKGVPVPPLQFDNGEQLPPLNLSQALTFRSGMVTNDIRKPSDGPFVYPQMRAPWIEIEAPKLDLREGCIVRNAQDRLVDIRRVFNPECWMLHLGAEQFPIEHVVKQYEAGGRSIYYSKVDLWPYFRALLEVFRADDCFKPFMPNYFPEPIAPLQMLRAPRTTLSRTIGQTAGSNSHSKGMDQRNTPVYAWTLERLRTEMGVDSEQPIVSTRDFALRLRRARISGRDLFIDAEVTSILTMDSELSLVAVTHAHAKLETRFRLSKRLDDTAAFVAAEGGFKKHGVVLAWNKNSRLFRLGVGDN